MSTLKTFAVAASILASNGSFEAPNIVGGGSYGLYTTGSTGITGYDKGLRRLWRR